ncbi:hypothetical protein [Pseudohongiella spirulinae]|nr:hypothetical protein [Pseudohongiella spirulinae]
MPTLVEVVESLAFSNDAADLKSRLAEGEWIMVPVGIHVAFSLSRADDQVPETVSVVVKVVAPDGRVHADRDVPILHLDMTEVLKQRAFLRFEHFPYIVDGTYKISLEFVSDSTGDKSHQEIPLDLIFSQEEGDQEQTDSPPPKKKAKRKEPSKK